MATSFMGKAKTALLGPRSRTISLCVLAATLMAVVSFLPFGQTLENRSLDLFYRLRPTTPQPLDLLIVAIDEPSFQELPYPWPWPRRLHGDLVRRLVAGGARLIVFDLVFAGATTPEEDNKLADALREAGNVVLGLSFEVARDPRFTRRILITPHKSFENAAKGQGLSLVVPDADGVVRHFHLGLGEQETLPLAALRLIRRKGLPAAKLTGLIDYAGPARSIDTVSYYQVIDPERPLPPSRIRGRIVLVGHVLEASATPQTQADAFYTPFFAKDGQRMSGVEIEGNILNTLLNGSWGRELPGGERLLLLVAVILAAGLVLARLKPVTGLIFLGASLAVLLGLSFGLLYLSRWWFPPVLMSMGLMLVYAGSVLGHYFTEAREKHWLRQAFGRYVAPSVVEVITTRPDRLELGGEELETTVLFADLEGFTRLSEALPPQTLIKLLNDYFTPMTQIIMAHRGTLDKYIGDAIMALWGAPVPLVDHALRACRAALEMEKTMTELQAQWQAQGLPPMMERLGLHTGPVVAGNVGSKDRFNYTVLGDTVNMASLLEEVNKIYGTRILLSEETSKSIRDHLLVREVDTVQVRGRSQTMTVYELVGPHPSGGPPPWLDIFATGLKLYRQRQWAEAAQLFEEVMRLKPQDCPSQVFVKRCRSLAKKPPPPDWQAVAMVEAN